MTRQTLTGFVFALRQTHLALVQLTCWLFLLAAMTVGCGAAIAWRPAALRCDYRENPLGLDVELPHLSWVLESSDASRRGVRQTAFQILVASERERLVPGRADLWDSGKVASDQMAHIAYAGRPLQSHHRYWWTVRVWDERQQVSEWAEHASWTMGLLAPSDWQARWIEAPDAAGKSNSLPLFRREFAVVKPVRRATAYVCGLGFYEMQINGRKVGEAVLDTGWTDYRKSCLYATQDVTDLIRRGTNVLATMLGNGMYNIVGGRYTKFKGSFGPPKLIMQVHLEFADGTTEEIVTDGTWKTSPGPVIFSCIFGGEDYDARLAPRGWEQPGFKDADWSAVVETEGPGGRLVSQSTPPIQVMRTFRPVNITEPRPGIFVYDLGQNFAGWPHLIVEGAPGANIKLIPGELLTADGLVEQGWSGSPVWFQYTLRGEGRETWHPRFSYYGFRYVQVEGAVPAAFAASHGGKPVLVELTGEFTYSSARRVGQFECSNQLINRIHALILGAIDSNMQSIITDCPHREKLGWLEVSHLLGRAVMFNYDVATLYRKISRDAGDAQLTNGLVPDIAPEFTVFEDGFRDSPEWGSACTINPWLLFKVYGDKQVIEEQYDVMRRYVDYLGSRATNHIVSHGLGDWCDVGPKVAGESQLTSKGLTATAIYHEDIEILRQVAALLGRETEAQQWAALGKQVRRAFNARFFNQTLNQYDRGSQTASAMPLVLGLVEPEKTDGVIQKLVETVRANNNRVTAGDIGFRFLVEALRSSGHSEVLFDLVTQEDGPGYAMQLAKGATTLTETWDASIYSRNHCMLGHAEEWFYTGVAGINLDPTSAGFQRIVIAPHPVGDLLWAKGTYDSMSGRIESSWKIENGIFRLEVQIPHNTAATVWVPVKEAASVKEGQRSAKQAKGVKFLISERGATAFAVGSGRYNFSAPWEAK